MPLLTIEMKIHICTYINISISHHRNPTTTGTSVLAIRFNGGVMLAADTLLSYGSMAMFRDCDRLMKVNDQIVMGGGGDYADFQYIQHAIEERV